MMHLYNSYKSCQQLFKQYSKSYYLGATLFDFEKFKHICAFYGLVRVVDNIVDGDNTIEEKTEQLELFINKFFCLYDSDLESCYWVDYHPIMPAVFNTIHQLKLPRDLFERFFASMKMDLVKYSYETFTELEHYMDGSAVIVGEVMLYIMSYKCRFYDNKFKELLPYARDLGVAFQLTNFIRDIKEDLEMDPSRIYIPTYFLKCYDIDLNYYNKEGIIDTNFREFIKCQINLNREIYKNAQYGINKLEPIHKMSINMSKILYSTILKYIENADYKLLESKKIKVPFKDKLLLMYKNIPLFMFFKMLINYVLYSYFMFIYFISL